MSEEHKLMDVKEVSQHLRVSTTTIYKLSKPQYRIYDATFPRHLRIGRKVYWLRVEI